MIGVGIPVGERVSGWLREFGRQRFPSFGRLAWSSSMVRAAGPKYYIKDSRVQVCKVLVVRQRHNHTIIRTHLSTRIEREGLSKPWQDLQTGDW